MTVLSNITIEDRILHSRSGHHHPLMMLLITPFEPVQKQACGLSYGLSPAGYDIRVGKIDGGKQAINLKPGKFVLLASLEKFQIPSDLVAVVHDKSTLARKGLALQNTVLEPGWAGYITLELSNHGPEAQLVQVGQPIAQVLFHKLDMPTSIPYTGKYQNQSSEPTHAIDTTTSTST